MTCRGAQHSPIRTISSNLLHLQATMMSGSGSIVEFMRQLEAEDSKQSTHQSERRVSEYQRDSLCSVSGYSCNTSHEAYKWQSPNFSQVGVNSFLSYKWQFPDMSQVGVPFCTKEKWHLITTNFSTYKRLYESREQARENVNTSCLNVHTCSQKNILRCVRGMDG